MMLWSSTMVMHYKLFGFEDSSLGNEDWIEIPPIHDALVVNNGDALQVIWSSKDIPDLSLGNEDWIEIPPIHDALVVHFYDALQIQCCCSLQLLGHESKSKEDYKKGVRSAEDFEDQIITLESVLDSVAELQCPPGWRRYETLAFSDLICLKLKDCLLLRNMKR
ncbi:hypothetical protein Tco_0877284 [Tanacetum coccineum]|uniref:Uncharacterized protein n=1 Tax=Tanacetum coccineum TaxID=301880 RepID=A0ABQ5BW60_9ASTR